MPQKNGVVPDFFSEGFMSQFQNSSNLQLPLYAKKKFPAAPFEDCREFSLAQLTGDGASWPRGV